MRNSSSLGWLRFMHTPNDYRVSREPIIYESKGHKKKSESFRSTFKESP